MVGSLSQEHLGPVNYRHPRQSANNSSETSPTSGSFPHGPIKYNTASSVASASEHFPRSGATNPVKNIPKPVSKSSLGTVTVKFHPPGFQTFKATVTANGKPIDSQKLRHQAIESFVQQTFPEVGTSFAINTQAEFHDHIDAQTNTRITDSVHDHIIFPFRNTAQKKWIKSSIGGKSDVVKDVKKKPKRGTNTEEEDVHCLISEGALSDEDFNRLRIKNLKARNLDILLRTLANRDLVTTEPSQGILDMLDMANSGIIVAMTSNQNVAKGDSSNGYDVQLRTRMSLDFMNSSVRFHYDLVPVIPIIHLSRLVRDVLGSDPIVKDGTLIIPADRKEVDHVSMLRHMLCGLKVRCGYIPKGDFGARRLDASTSSDGRCFQIKDVRFPDDEKTKFRTADGTLYTVPDYFNTVILKGQDDKLAHPDWPVAQDDSEAWIPLEMLYVAPNQVLSRCGHLNERLISMARKYMKNQGDFRLRDHARVIFKGIAATPVGKEKTNIKVSGEGNSATTWMDNYTLSFEFSHNSDLFPDRKPVAFPVASQTEKLKIALLQIVSKRGESVDSTLFERLKAGLRKTYCLSYYETTANNILTNDKSINDVFAGDHRLILAVTSESFTNIKSDPTTARPKQIFAHLRNLCELEHGTMLVSETGTSLAELDAISKGPKDHCPKGIQRRIDFMLGKPNFKSSILSTVSADLRERFMIMGAHIMHKSLHEKKRTKYIPSVAAVVASTNGTALTFPGSSRFQRTTAKITDSGRVPEHSIPDLQGMLSERFKAWADQKTPPAYILFYRDSIEFDNNVAWKECNDILAAFMNHFEPLCFGQLQVPMLTYIVVNKNTELRYLPHGPDAPSAHLNQDFVIEQGKAKHRYYVVCNDSNLSREHLQGLTRDLNDSNQLYPQRDQVAKALPLTWAANLCERVHGYVASAKPEDLALKEIERLKKPTEQEIKDEDEAIADVKKYLEIDDTETRRLPWKEKLDYRMFYL